MTGKEAIIEKILSDAEGFRAETLREAKSQAQSLIESAEEECQRYRARQAEINLQERTSAAARKVTVAELEEKKKLLAVKQQALSTAFERAAEQIYALPDKDYKAFLAKLIAKFAEDGDVAVLSQADSDRVTEKDVAEFAAAAGVAVKTSEKKGSFKGGLILEGKIYDKNLSLDALLSRCRQEREAEIASLLFE